MPSASVSLHAVPVTCTGGSRPTSTDRFTSVAATVNGAVVPVTFGVKGGLAPVVATTSLSSASSPPWSAGENPKFEGAVTRRVYVPAGTLKSWYCPLESVVVAALWVPEGLSNTTRAPPTPGSPVSWMPLALRSDHTKSPIVANSLRSSSRSVATCERERRDELAAVKREVRRDMMEPPSWSKWISPPAACARPSGSAPGWWPRNTSGEG
jgi:hypothetical protein